jgi:hypothetical protein
MHPYLKTTVITIDRDSFFEVGVEWGGEGNCWKLPGFRLGE